MLSSPICTASMCTKRREQVKMRSLLDNGGRSLPALMFLIARISIVKVFPRLILAAIIVVIPKWMLPVTKALNMHTRHPISDTLQPQPIFLVILAQ